ncbi:glycerol-3-phosphate acyltransferase 2, mitochondrial-like isoform X2 [Melanerpes formicivorus]|uniref:glycerol-3-phosphate acyltransferase 2, mitochondrial-like isoform X2 n=1 Tax=Melanerpes formicivorus TaxID=211600 RepID=UPI00358DF0E6
MASSDGDRGPKMRTWLCDWGQRLEIFLPFLGTSRPLLRRCCQTCTPKSWDGFYQQRFSSLGFRDAIRVTEEDTRFRGWLVRRVCALLAVWGWQVPADTPGDLPARIYSSKRLQDVSSSCSPSSRGDSKSSQRWKEKVLQILAEIQAPLSLLLLRLCHWALLKLLNRLFLNVQLHRGQLEMVLRASSTVRGREAAREGAVAPPGGRAERRLPAPQPGLPLVFLSTHKAQLDGLLLSFILFSQGLGVPRVAVGGQPCSPPLRALLRHLGAIFLPARMEQDQELREAVLTTYVEEVLRSCQPLLIFLEEPPTSLQLSAVAQRWLALVYRAVRGGAVPDALLVPVGIAYDLVPGGARRQGARAQQPLGLGACVWAACQALCQGRGCVRVDFAQPFSLQEFAAKILTRGSSAGRPPAKLLLPSILGLCPSQLEAKRAEVWGPGSPTASGLEAEEEMVVTELGLHALSDGIGCSAVMAVGITSALLLHKHREGVLLSQLMLDFAWLLEELLLRQQDVGFSGQLRALVQHSLSLLRAHLTCYHLAPLGDILVVPKASAEARRELSCHSAAILPVLAREALGACAIRALLLEMLPFLGAPAGPSGVVLSEEELCHKILQLLQLLPPNLLGLQPCQPLDCQSQDIVDKLLLCGLLEVQVEGKPWGCDLASQRARPWAGLDDSDSEEELPKRCYKLQEPPGSPGFLFFLCRLLSPVLRTYGSAAAFLEQPCWPQPEESCVEALLQFLAQEDGVEHLSWSLALSSLQTFKALGVLEEMQTPTGVLLQPSHLLQSGTNQGKLAAFIQQFHQP